jgi:hypothetical protein
MNRICFFILIFLWAICHGAFAQTDCEECSLADYQNCFPITAKKIGLGETSQCLRVSDVNGKQVTLVLITDDKKAQQKVHLFSKDSIFDWSLKLMEARSSFEIKLIVNGEEKSFLYKLSSPADMAKPSTPVENATSGFVPTYYEAIAYDKKGYTVGPDFSIIDPFKKTVKNIDLQRVGIEEIITPSISGSAWSKLLGADMTMHAQAAGDFLAQRVKEELTIAFVDKFKTAIDTIPELRMLLPKTHLLLTTTDPFEIPSFGQTYKTAFIQDIEKMIYNFEILINTEPKYAPIKNTPEFTAFAAAYRAADLITKQESIVDVFETLHLYYGNDQKATPAINIGNAAKDAVSVNNLIELLYVLSESLRDLSSPAATSWIRAEDYQKLNANQKKLFFALLYQRNQKLFENIVIDNKSLIKGTAGIITVGKIEKSDRAVKLLLKTFDNFTSQLEYYKEIFDNDELLLSEKKKQVVPIILQTIKNITYTLEPVVQLCYLANEPMYEQSKYFRKVKPILEDVYTLVEGWYQDRKNYAGMVVNTLSVITSVHGHTSELFVLSPDRIKVYTDSLQKIEGIGRKSLDTLKAATTVRELILYTNVVAAANKEYQKQIHQKLTAFLSVSAQQSFARNQFVRTLAHTTSFMIDIINADSVHTVKAALNRYADPVGSYRLKRYSLFSISLNAYPGIYGGWEYDFKHASTNVATFGITAPIGLSLNWGKRYSPSKTIDKVAASRYLKNEHFFVKKNKLRGYKGSSHSLFIAALDIGAVLSYRWNTDTIDLPQKITLGQIFSPGVFYILGIKNTPLALKTGVQYAPLLRSINASGNTVAGAGAWRFSMALCVDIPVIHLYRKQ